MVSPVRTLAQGMAPQRRELVLAGILGAVASMSAVALLGTSAWLISRAAEMPPVLTLSVAAVLVRAFALSRAVFRYAERLVGHDAAFRGLTGLRVTVFEQLERLAPTGLAVIGVTLVAAMLVIPAVIARMLTDSFGRMLAYSTVIGTLCGLIGMYLSYYAGVPSGTMIVLVGAALFIVVLAATGGRGLRRSSGLDSHSEDLLAEKAA